MMCPLSLCSSLGDLIDCGSTTALEFVVTPEQHIRVARHSDVPRRGSKGLPSIEKALISQKLHAEFGKVRPNLLAAKL